MIKYAFVLLSIGFVLGILQATYVYDKTYTNKEKINQTGEVVCLALIPECGACYPGATIDGEYCVQSETKPVRGFPLSTAGSGINWQTNQPIGWQHAVNFLLFIIPGTLLLLVAKLKRKGDAAKK